MKVGAITIGQAPREDVAGEFLSAAGPGIELVQAGALDGLSLSEIEALAPASPGSCPDTQECGKPGTGILVTRLLDGREVKVDEARILPLMQKRLKELEVAGVSLVLLFCTGDFPPFDSRVPVLRPDFLLAHFVAALGAAEGGATSSGGGKWKICAVIPSADQEAEVKAKWRKFGIDVEVIALSPYASTDSEVEEAVSAAGRLKPDLVVLDCIGFSAGMKARFSRRCNVPVILPRSLLGRATAELAAQ